jgi:putative ABC transport system permease protein
MNISRSAYRALLRLCPADLRREFGAEMEAAFLAELAHADGAGKCGLWCRAVIDVVRHGAGARGDSWRRVRHTSSYVEYEKGGWRIGTLRYDLRHAVRAMRRQPTTSLIVIVTLALAIGANTAVFSAVHSVLIRPLPYPHPESLTMVWEKRQAEGVMDNSVSAADFLDWSRMAKSFTAMTAFSEVTADLTGAGEPEKVPLCGVTATFFDVLGVRAVVGRTFAAGDDTPGRHNVVILAHRLWQQRFGGDVSIVGRSITLNGGAFQVIGVLPANAAFPHTEAQVFAPLVLLWPGRQPSRTSLGLGVYARVKPGVPFEQARAEMDSIGKSLERMYPQANHGHGANVTRLAEEVTEPAERTLMVLMAAVAFILLIACINVTNLLLATAAGRQREMAIRSAIGADRMRLVRQVIVECAVMALCGGALGLLLALWSVQVLGAQLPALVRPDHGVVFSVPVLLFTVVLCLVTAAFAGGLPAWHLVREDPVEPLKEGGRSPVSLKRGLRFGLIVAEVALTSLLLVGAGLTLRSFEAVLSQPAGIETADRLTFRVGLPGAIYQTPESALRLFVELESRLAAEPQVEAIGATSLPPLTGLDGRQGVVIENRGESASDGPTRAHPRIVTPDYTKAIGATIRVGRGFLATDTAASTPVVIVNETMANRYWPDASPIGKRVRFADEEQWREVVGIIGDVKHWGLDAPVNPEIYLPMAQRPSWAMTFVAHSTSGDPGALVPLVRRHLRELDPNLPLFQVRTMADVAAKSVEKRQWTMTLLAAFALLALLLAAAGIYGVMSHLVSLRTPEIGVRLTLGAQPGSVMRQVLSEGLLQTAIGLTIGLIASLGLMRGLRTILFGIEPTDPMTLVSVGVSLLVVAILAVSVPAWRAMRVVPISALRK